MRNDVPIGAAAWLMTALLLGAGASSCAGMAARHYPLPVRSPQARLALASIPTVARADGWTVKQGSDGSVTVMLHDHVTVSFGADPCEMLVKLPSTVAMTPQEVEDSLLDAYEQGVALWRQAVAQWSTTQPSAPAGGFDQPEGGSETLDKTAQMDGP